MTRAQALHIAYDGEIAVVTVNRPSALNALNHSVLTLLEQAIGELERNARAVVLTGAGHAFAAGADISELIGMDGAGAREFSEYGQAVLARIERTSIPWIAAVNGLALGGGCELALACDFVYAAKTARLGLPEVTLGVIPGFGGAQRLVSRVGSAKARELILTGEAISAGEALRIGLVDAVFEPSELLSAARNAAAKIAKNDAVAVAAAKGVILEGVALAPEAARAVETAAFADLFGSAHQKERMSAFLNVHRPRRDDAPASSAGDQS